MYVEIMMTSVQLHREVLKELDKFISNLQQFGYTVRVKFKCRKKEYGSKVKITIYKRVRHNHVHNYPWAFASSLIHKVTTEVDLNILRLLLTTLEVQVESLYNS